jgi:hypothetical protein
MFNALDMEHGWKIALIIRKSRLFSEEEFRRRMAINLAGIDLFAATPEDVIVSKLEWSKLGQSQRHIDDAAGVLRMRGDSLDRSYVEKWIAELGLVQEWECARASSGISG